MSKAISGNELATVRPDLAAQWHPTKNGDLTPDTIAAQSNKQVWWQCEKGHEWQARVQSRTRGVGCPVCSGKKVLAGYNDLATTHPEIAAEWHPTKNGTLTPEQVTYGSTKRIWWQCEKGHEWQVTVNNRTYGNRGCPYCFGREAWPGYNDLATLNPELAAEWHPTKNGDLTPSAVVPGSEKKVWWQCEKGHEWQARIYSRSYGFGCPICSSEKHTSFPEQAIFYYLTQTTPAENRYVLNGKVEIDIYLPEYQTGIEYDGEAWHKDAEKDIAKNHYCEKNGVRIIRIREPGCPSIPGECILLGPRSTKSSSLNAAIKTLLHKLGKNIDVDVDRDSDKIIDLLNCSEKENSFASLYPDLAAEWHPTKNGKLTPEQVFPGSNKRVWWQCSEGHEWQSTVNNRTYGNRGCPYCSGREAWPGYNDLATLNPELAAEWHPSKNGALTPEQVTKGSHKKVWWQCSEGHEWQAIVKHRFEGDGCPICSGKIVLPGFNDLATVNPELAAEWHPTKNGDLTPEQVTKGSRKKVWWICEKGHEWQVTVANRSIGRGCRECAKMSIGEKLAAQAVSRTGSLASIHPELISEWHPAKNGDLTPEQVSYGSGKKVWWCCSEGHEWQATVKDRSLGKGCPICAIKKRVETRKKRSKSQHL